MYKTIYTEVEVDVDISDFDDDDLVDELESRGYTIVDNDDYNGYPGDGLLTQIYLLRKLGKPYERELEQYIWHTIGKM